MASSDRRSAAAAAGALHSKSPSFNDETSSQIIANRYQIVDKLTKSKQSNIFSVLDTKTDEMLVKLNLLSQNLT